MPTEAQVQAAIIEALVFDGWLVIRVNQGGMQDKRLNAVGQMTSKRYVRFAFWQMLGQPATDKGISDLLAMKAGLDINRDMGYMDGRVGPIILAIEVKAPGKKAKLSRALIAPLESEHRELTKWFEKLDDREKNQTRFLWSVIDHGGIAIVADCLEDVAPYLDRAEVQ